jgi:hypothetical protein
LPCARAAKPSAPGSWQKSSSKHGARAPSVAGAEHWVEMGWFAVGGRWSGSRALTVCNSARISAAWDARARPRTLLRGDPAGRRAAGGGVKAVGAVNAVCRTLGV